MRIIIINSQFSRLMFTSLLCALSAGYVESSLTMNSSKIWDSHSTNLISELAGSTRDELSNDSSEIRVRRATDAEFSTMLDRIQMISRLATGIYLQCGITNGTIDSERLISEYLNFGTTTPSEVMAISTDKLDEIVDGINRLRELTSDENIKKLEDRVIVYNKFVKKTKGMDRYSMLSDKDEYKVQLKQFRDAAELLYLPQLENSYSSNINSYIHHLDRLEASDNENDADASLRNLNSLFEFEKLSNPENSFPLLFPVYETIEEYSEMVETLDHTIKTDIQKNIDNVSEIVKATQLNANHVERLFNMLLSRNSESTKASNYLTGFFNFDSDIFNIFKDLGTDWMKKAVYGQADNLENAMNQLKAVGNMVRAVNISILIYEPKMLKEITDVHSNLIQLDKYAEAVKMFLGGIKKVNIPTLNTNVRITEKEVMSELVRNMKLLSSKISTLKRMHRLMNALRTEENGKKLAQITRIANITGDKLKLYRDSQAFKDIHSLVLEVDGANKILEGPASTEIIEGILKNLTALEVFQEDVKIFYKEIVTLREIPQLDVMANAVEVIKTFRNSTFEITSLDTVTFQLREIKQKLSYLSSFLKESKRPDQIEVNYLSEFTNIDVHSRIVGTATRVIFNMQKLVGEDIEFEAFGAMKKLLKREVLYIEKRMDSKDLTNLKSLAGIRDKLKKVVEEVRMFKKKLLPATSTNLLDYSGIFIEAKKVHGIRIDWLALIVSVEKLKVILSSAEFSIVQLDKLRITLQTLKSIALDFSEFTNALVGSPKSLQALEVSLAKYKDTLIQAKKEKGSSLSPSQTGLNFMEEGSPYTYIGVSIGIVIILCLILFAIWNVYQTICDKKEFEEKLKVQSSS